jgi:poly-gamma-glutamate capsule biosynthesis protein CapA/YwtB (metallophosphatase superfamily)
MSRVRLLALLLIVAAAAYVVREWSTGVRDLAAPADVPALGPITIALTGDTLLHHPTDGVAANDEGVERVRSLIAGATLAFTNLEMNLLDSERQLAAAGQPARWPFGAASHGRALRNDGFDLVSLANNHGTDFGIEGLESTRRLLDAAGLRYAGSGGDLPEARRPVLTGGPRRVALLSVTTSSSADSRATAPAPGLQGRPGVSPLRYYASISVDAPTFQTLRDAVAPLNAGPPPGERSLTFFGTVITRGDATRIEFDVNEQDEQEIIEHVRAARAAAEVVIVSIHSHEPSNGAAEPPEFLQGFARKAVDAGAHLVVGHGPHRIRGVEVYRGSAILYSLGNFLYEAPPDFGAADAFDAGLDLYGVTLGALSPRPRGSSAFPPDDSWGRGAVAVAEFEEGRLMSLRLHPIVLDWNTTARPGWAREASGETGRSILEELAAASAGRKTELRIDTAGVANVTISAPGQR